jgi:hypothetical protein
MAHPETSPVAVVTHGGRVAQRVNPALSPLMAAKAKNKNGGVVNFCPFGCDIEDLDHVGYCHHLIGFTIDKKEFEPMVDNPNKACEGLSVVQVRREPHPTKPNRTVRVLEPILEGDVLVQITSSYRVYRRREAPPDRAPRRKPPIPGQDAEDTE